MRAPIYIKLKQLYLKNLQKLRDLAYKVKTDSNDNHNIIQILISKTNERML